jgi:hypothetical protein
LQKCQIVAVDLRLLPGVFDPCGKRVSHQHLEGVERRGLITPLLNSGLGFVDGEQERCLRIVNNGVDSGKMTGVAGRVGGNRNGSGVQAAEKRGEKLQSRRIEEQNPFSPCSMLV